MPTPIDIMNLPSGAQWVKADLHVHTPASSDIDEKWKTATPADVVRIATEKGLDVIGITDHNTAAWCDLVRLAAAGTDLVVFPGVEISTPQGHLLALFNNDVPSSHIEDLLVTVGISRDEFGCLDVATEHGIVGVSAAITKVGGVAIAAHADGDRGFLKMIQVGSERERAYVTPDLRAMEILDTSSRNDHQSGARYHRRMTCLQSSDCWPKGADRHQLDGMGYRYSFLKMGERSISGLKLALIDPEIRVRLPKDDLLSPEYAILGMWVTGGFLDGQIIRFNENVNCFIGDTGSGKSVATELIRFGLDQQPVVEKIRKEVEGLLQQQLGDLGVVHILVEKGGSRYLIERTWSSTPQTPLVQRVTENGLQSVDELDMRRFFPIKCFSQSEIIEFAREPDVRLSLTDDLIDCSVEFGAIKDVKARLGENTAAIIAEQAKEGNIRSQLVQRGGLAEDIERIDSILNDPRIAQQQRWYAEQTILGEAKNQVIGLREKLTNATAQLDIAPSWPDNLDTFPNRDILEKVRNACQDWQGHVARVRIEAEAKLETLIGNFEVMGQEWDVRFAKSEAVYRELLEVLDEDGIGLQALSERRKSIQGQLSVLNVMDQELQVEILPRIDNLIQQREGLLNQLQDNRKFITRKRKQKAKQLSTKLDHKIRLQVHGRANTVGFREALRGIATGSYLQNSDILSLAAKCHPVPFVKQLLAKDFESLSQQCGLEPVKLGKLWDTIVGHDKLTDLYELQLTDVEDVIDVQLQVDPGNYRRLEELSHGQKCMVILMVALAEGDFPLLVDQPEDALHAPSIEEGIVSTLRLGRGGRQCLFATRNANILVSADAEQIIALKADAQNGQVVGTGSLDGFDHRQLIIYHVEGGEEAFQRRKTMYTLEPSI